MRLRIDRSGTHALKLQLNKLHLSSMYGGQFADHIGTATLSEVEHHFILVGPYLYMLDHGTFNEEWEID